MILAENMSSSSTSYMGYQTHHTSMSYSKNKPEKGLFKNETIKGDLFEEDGSVTEKEASQSNCLLSFLYCVWLSFEKPSMIDDTKKLDVVSETKPLLDSEKELKMNISKVLLSNSRLEERSTFNLQTPDGTPLSASPLVFFDIPLGSSPGLKSDDSGSDKCCCSFLFKLF